MHSIQLYYSLSDYSLLAQYFKKNNLSQLIAFEDGLVFYKNHNIDIDWDLSIFYVTVNNYTRNAFFYSRV